MSNRERLTQAIADNHREWFGRISESKGMPAYIADALIADGWTRIPTPPPPVLEVTFQAREAYANGVMGTNGPPMEERSNGLRAAFPHLLRACADGLTDEECERIARAIDWSHYDGGLIRTILRRVAARREA